MQHQCLILDRNPVEEDMMEKWLTQISKHSFQTAMHSSNECGSSVCTMSALYASKPKIKPHSRHIFGEFFSLLPIQGEPYHCQLLAKEWTLNTGKLSPGGLPRNRVVK